MKFLLLALLIGYCCGYKRPRDQLRRRTRNVDLKDEGQRVLNQVMSDQERVEQEIKDAIRKDEDTIRMVTQNITLAAKKIAEFASQDVASAQQWTFIQGQIRLGINVIINGYRRFTSLHRDTCDSIETFTKKIIEKYELELSILDQLSGPSTRSGNIDTNNPNYDNSTIQFLELLKYLKFHQDTMCTAHDASLDIYLPEIARQRAISQNVGTYQYYSGPSLAFPISCGAIAENNAGPNCAMSLASASISLLKRACPSQCS